MNIEVPDSVTRAQVVAAIKALGIDPARVYSLDMNAEDRHITVGMRTELMVAVVVDIPILEPNRPMRRREEPST